MNIKDLCATLFCEGPVLDRQHVSSEIYARIRSMPSRATGEIYTKVHAWQSIRQELVMDIMERDAVKCSIDIQQTN